MNINTITQREYKNNNGDPYVLKPLISQAEIEHTVRKLADEISTAYKTVHLIGLLKGSFMFLSDLIRCMSIPVTVDFMAVTSYMGTESTGEVKILKELNEPIHDKQVLIIEDIIDTGITLKKTLELLSTREPAGLYVCTLLDKAERRKTEIDVRYNGISIPDEFVVGYGIDYEQRHREINDIRTVSFL